MRIHRSLRRVVTGLILTALIVLALWLPFRPTAAHTSSTSAWLPFRPSSQVVATLWLPFRSGGVRAFMGLALRQRAARVAERRGLSRWLWA
jgi:hypothetical protein